MKGHILRNALFYATFIGAYPAIADEKSIDLRLTKGIGFYMDQDFLVPGRNEDRDYTMGFAFELFWEEEAKNIPLLDDALKQINSYTSLMLDKESIKRSLMIGSVNYTPDDLANSEPIFDDRPYASLLYLSTKLVVTGPERAIGTELQVGLLGLELAKTLQTKLHGYTRSLTDDHTPVDPEGWDHQISDGGEPTF